MIVRVKPGASAVEQLVVSRAWMGVLRHFGERNKLPALPQPPAKQVWP